MDTDTRTFESELTHFGVKGMRWGIRKRRESRSGFENAPVKEQPHHGGAPSEHINVKAKTGGKEPTPVQAKIVPGKPIQTRGGKRQPTTDEALRAAGLKQQLHASGKQSLTNEEMRFLADRLGLEQRLSQLAPKPKNKGLVFAQKLIKSPVPSIALGVAASKLPEEAKLMTAQHKKILKGMDFAEMLLKNLGSPIKSPKRPKKEEKKKKD